VVILATPTSEASLEKGKNNVVYNLNNSVNINILGVGCAVHFIPNALQTSADMLPVDVESNS
jgi:hypothetical protein